MTLEESIKNTIEQKMQDGTIDRLISDHMEKSINKALEDLFGSWGDITKIIRDQIKSVMIPFIESHDYSNYIIKLDTVLKEIIETSTQSNRILMENFKALFGNDAPKEITVSKLFDMWCKYVAVNVKTDGLNVNTDDSPSYEPVEVCFDVIDHDRPSWSIFDNALLIFECEHDPEMNFEIGIYKYAKTPMNRWDIKYKQLGDIESLRHLNSFAVTLINMCQCGTKIVLDERCGSEEVYIEAEPEATFS